jgi:hypothetical protein
MLDNVAQRRRRAGSWRFLMMRTPRFLTLVALAFAFTLTLGSTARAEESKPAGGEVKATEAAKAPEKGAAATKAPEKGAAATKATAAEAKGCCCWTKKTTTKGEASADCSDMTKTPCDAWGRAFHNTKWHAGACTDADKSAK